MEPDSPKSLAEVQPELIVMDGKIHVVSRFEQFRDTLGLKPGETPLSEKQWAHIKAFFRQNSHHTILEKGLEFNHVRLAYSAFLFHDTPYINLGFFAKGGLSEIHLLINEQGDFFILKKVFDRDNALKSQISHEINQSQRENMLLGFTQQDATHYLLLKPIDGYNLYDIFTELKFHGKFTPTQKMNFMLEMIQSMLMAVDIFHRKNTVHSDLKPHNFIWSENVAQLIDFDMAYHVDNLATGKKIKETSGTIYFFPPEFLENLDIETVHEIYNKLQAFFSELPFFDKVWDHDMLFGNTWEVEAMFDPEQKRYPANGPRDIYALGASILTLVFIEGKYSFKEVTPPLSAKQAIHLAALYDLCIEMVQYDPSKRLTIQECVTKWNNLPLLVAKVETVISVYSERLGKAKASLEMLAKQLREQDLQAKSSNLLPQYRKKLGIVERITCDRIQVLLWQLSDAVEPLTFSNPKKRAFSLEETLTEAFPRLETIIAVAIATTKQIYAENGVTEQTTFLKLLEGLKQDLDQAKSILLTATGKMRFSRI